ncbi:MAG TPA: hypothetical protein VLH41_05055, partial [Thermoanaerobaculia bacterium]|nr:hypothetical protein [Thermoanaerobaculia bacterium]
MKTRILPTLLLASALVPACGGKKPEPPKPRSVRLVPAAKQTLARTVAAVGTLAAEDRADLSFKVP